MPAANAGAGMWMSPLGGANTDWGALEKMLDGDGSTAEIRSGQWGAAYYGEATGAHFWGQSECPVQRPVAAVVPVGRGEDWRTGNWAGRAKEERAKAYKEAFSQKVWPKGSPASLDSGRILSAITPPKAQKRVVAGQAVVKGLYIAPLDDTNKELLRKAAHDDFLASLKVNLLINGIRSTRAGTTFYFHVDASEADAKGMADKMKTGFAGLKVPTMEGVYQKFGVRPSAFKLDPAQCKVVVRKRLCVRGDLQSGAAADDYDLGKAMTGVAKAGGYSSVKPVSSPAKPTSATGTTRGTAAAAPVKRGVKVPVAQGQRPSDQFAKAEAASRSTGASASASKPAKPMTAQEKKRALLKGVIKRTEQQVVQVESENRAVPATHEIQNRKAAVAKANAELAKERGIVDFGAQLREAKDSLQPPSEWQGALVREENGKKQFENFELHIVSDQRESRMMLGRARVQNGKLDMTYQCKVRCLKKDDALTVEMVLDNSGVCKGKFARAGVLTGTFRFPNGTGTFKLMRA